MIGLFLLTHSTYGEALIQCACHVLNKRPLQIAQLGVAAQDDPLDTLPLARDLLKLVDTGRGGCGADRWSERPAWGCRRPAGRYSNGDRHERGDGQ